jgi:tetratricopeptide (TPR) repeat protein
MLKPKKYDVVISFSDEQKDIAVALSIALENEGILTYYYPHKLEENVGKDLEGQLRQLYHSESVIAIAIFSQTYFSNHFTKIELDAILDRLQKEDDYLIPIRYNTIDKKIAHLTFKQWQSNPQEIAKIVKERLAKKVNFYLEANPAKIAKLPKSFLLSTITRLSKFNNLDNSDFCFRLALYYYYLNQSKIDLVKAKELLQKALLHNPSLHPAYFWLCKVTVEEIGINSIKYRQIKEPVNLLKKALEMAPGESIYREYARFLNSKYFKKHGIRYPF